MERDARAHLLHATIIGTSRRPRGSVAVDGAVVDRQAAADGHDAAAGPVKGAIALDRTVVYGDCTEDSRA